MPTISNFVWHLKFVRKKPHIALRLAKDIFAVRVLRQRRLRTIDWAITYRCNSSCTMCSAKHLMGNKMNRGKKELTPEQMLDVWRQAVRLGAVHLNLTGGEPTIRCTDEVVKIISLLNREGALISMVTNSISMTREKLRAFAEAGLDTLQLSLEGMNPKVHDGVRNTPGNYEKLMQVFRWAKELRLNICLSAVITGSNFGEIKRIIDFGRKEGVFVLLNPISASGEKAGDFSGSIRDKKREYYKLLKEGHVRADTIFNFRGGSGCPGGERIEITAYGDVMSCPHVQVSYGNVLKEQLSKIYRRISGFPYLRDFQKDCRHVFNDEYIEKIMKPTFGTYELPVSIYDHPVARDEEVKEFLRRTA
jgi:MoaA/NifB/PqqE/SkfB family radical SAM enzyme